MRGIAVRMKGACRTVTNVNEVKTNFSGILSNEDLFSDDFGMREVCN